VIFQHSQQQWGILALYFLLPYPLASDLPHLSDPKLNTATTSAAAQTSARAH